MNLKLLVTSVLAGCALLLAACGGGIMNEDPKPVNLVGAFDCTGSAAAVGGFMKPVTPAVRLATAAPGSQVRLDIISGNSRADIGWVYAEVFESDRSLRSPNLIEKDYAERVAKAGRQASRALAAACRAERRTRGGSDVVSAVAVAANELAAGARPGSQPVFVMSSDGRHSLPRTDDWLNLETPGRLRPAQVVRRLRREGRLAEFPRGTRAYLVGLGRGPSLTHQEAARLEAIWRAVFRAGGAQIAYLGPRFPGDVTNS